MNVHKFFEALEYTNRPLKRVLAEAVLKKVSTFARDVRVASKYVGEALDRIALGGELPSSVQQNGPFRELTAFRLLGDDIRSLYASTELTEEQFTSLNRMYERAKKEEGL